MTYQSKNKKNATDHPCTPSFDKHHSIGHLQAQEVLVETSNPYFQPTYPESQGNPRTIIAVADAHSRPIALLYTKGHITTAQYKAAERFYLYWRQSQGDSHMSIDLTRTKVDGGEGHIHTMERRIEAANHLQTIKAELGVLGYRLVEQVVGYGQAIKDLSPSKRKQNSLADHLRDCLDLLAFHWKYSNQKYPQ
ncbi:hypothetical protein BAnh1_11130 [Bartonella australis AUST/NH1]|uniref:Uncharacterized protein n=1 Tax=Bartonella australis (strain Aust/NH1) TaxID=1094489 RepID=M1PED9_BARAA|nr:hypothetical protein [Bartonella australis]AGF74981.1 hypothetical protein BAnh1_11130 [Bartonella australis AUST/NH1]